MTVCYVIYGLAIRHIVMWGRCVACAVPYHNLWEDNVPSLSSVVGTKAAVTWADAVNKTDIERVPFWIHDVHQSDYTNDRGQEVSLLILDITLESDSRKAPRAVITLGNTEERSALAAYFSDRGNDHNPLGPCITYEVPMKNGQTFWRLEDAPNADDTPELPLNLPSRKRTAR